MHVLTILSYGSEICIFIKSTMNIDCCVTNSRQKKLLSFWLGKIIKNMLIIITAYQNDSVKFNESRNTKFFYFINILALLHRIY